MTSLNLKSIFFIIIFASSFFIFTKNTIAVGQNCCTGTQPNDPSTSYTLCPRPQTVDTRLGVCNYSTDINCSELSCVCLSYNHNNTPYGIPWNCAPDETCLSSSLTCVKRQVPVEQQGEGAQRCPRSSDIWTAIGCVSTEPDRLVSQLLTLGIGIGSGITFLMILLGSYQLLTSQGNPDGINHGKETITSAIVGLLFVVLSVTILQILGFDILGLGNMLGSR